MATISRVTPHGWVQFDDGAFSRVTPAGWLQSPDLTQTLVPDPIAVPVSFPAPALTFTGGLTPDPIAVALVFTPVQSTVSRVTPNGWVQYDASAAFSRITPSGWLQAPTQPQGLTLNYALTPDPIPVFIAPTAPEAVSRVTPSGWIQHRDTAAFSRVTPSGWLQSPATMPAAVITMGGVALTPDPATVPTAFPAPALTLGALAITPDPVTVPLVPAAPSLLLPTALTPSPVAVALAVPSPALTFVTALTPSPIAVSLALPVPTLTVPSIPQPFVITNGGSGWFRSQFRRLWRNPEAVGPATVSAAATFSIRGSVALSGTIHGTVHAAPVLSVADGVTVRAATQSTVAAGRATMMIVGGAGIRANGRCILTAASIISLENILPWFDDDDNDAEELGVLLGTSPEAIAGVMR